MIYKDISEQIEELRCKLHKELEKSGFDTKKALKISEELDELIENFYVEKNMKKTNDNNSLYKEYMIAYNRLKELLKKSVPTAFFPHSAVRQVLHFLCSLQRKVSSINTEFSSSVLIPKQLTRQRTDRCSRTQCLKSDSLLFRHSL